MLSEYLFISMSSRDSLTAELHLDAEPVSLHTQSAAASL